MGRIIFLILFCIAVNGDIQTHIYISKELNWYEAQAYCRHYHTDLSYFNSQSEIDKLRKDAGGSISKGWIGLQRDPNNDAVWMWSGGGHITYANWARGEPNYYRRIEDKGLIGSDGKWYDSSGIYSRPFYCIDVTVME
uniref:C-type lectin domain-containing protein n=1 Tax=Stegastes partitus TaxID=144197 RepID=A0A3B5AN26_9TELE